MRLVATVALAIGGAVIAVNVLLGPSLSVSGASPVLRWFIYLFGASLVGPSIWLFLEHHHGPKG